MNETVITYALHREARASMRKRPRHSVKTLIRKTKLSFVAMFWGWLACNGAFLFWATVSQPIRHWSKLASDFTFICICTGMVIMAAWLLIFLPVDLTIPDHSRLRQPRRAAICGFLAVILPSYAVLLCECLTRGGLQSFEDLFEALIDPWNGSFLPLPFTVGALITGTVAAFMRCWKDPNRKKT